MTVFPLHDLFPDLPRIDVVDIGASALGQPPYQRLVDEGSVARVIGFEPSPAEFKKLSELPRKEHVYLPYAIGDGNEAVLNICESPGMTSLLEPNLELLKHFHGYGEWGRIVERVPVATRRLDDVTEIDRVDYLKLDVQGSELAVLRGGARTLERTLIIHLEVAFVPLYKEQPLFGDLDLFLRAAGFGIHSFRAIKTKTLKPILVNNDVSAGINQLFEADAVYIRSIERFSELSPGDLLKIARVAHDVWGSYDLAALALWHADAKEGSSRQKIYIDSVCRQK
jgi:FkbM family methyltransferase